MITDTERREIAQRLRDCVKNKAEVEMLSLNGSSEAIRWLISSDVFGDKKYHSGVDLINRLADLIEPSCDRDALLALADEMFNDTTSFDITDVPENIPAWVVYKWQERIRETIGEEPLSLNKKIVSI